VLNNVYQVDGGGGKHQGPVCVQRSGDAGTVPNERFPGQSDEGCITTSATGVLGRGSATAAQVRLPTRRRNAGQARSGFQSTLTPICAWSSVPLAAAHGGRASSTDPTALTVSGVQPDDGGCDQRRRRRASLSAGLRWSSSHRRLYTTRR